VVTDQIAEYAEFFFGTNDLTQMMFGVSRDDSEIGFSVPVARLAAAHTALGTSRIGGDGRRSASDRRIESTIAEQRLLGVTGNALSPRRRLSP